MYEQTAKDQTYTPSWQNQRPAEKEGQSPTVFKPCQHVPAVQRRSPYRQLYAMRVTFY